MSLKPFITRFLFRALIVVEILSLTACGSAYKESADVEQPPTAELQPQVAEELQQEPESEGVAFEEAELPEGFPSKFPIPDSARIGSSVGMGGKDEFRVFLSLTTRLEESLSYYRTELASNGWDIDEEETTTRGVEMAIRSDDYEGELLFVEAEVGVALDVHLLPVGTGAEIPGVPTDLGDSTTLGEGASSFPADFPIPSSYTPIELNDTLRAEGYELAFTYAGIAEMGMVDFNIAVMSAGWEIGDPTIAGVSGIYIIPFSHPETGFEGYAFITSNPGQFNLDTGGTALIALARGQP